MTEPVRRLLLRGGGEVRRAGWGLGGGGWEAGVEEERNWFLVCVGDKTPMTSPLEDMQ